MPNIDNSADIIDSREIIDRIEELTADDERTQAESDELATLHALQAEASYAEDWQYGATLVRDTYFKEYAQQLAEDIGAIDWNATWPLYCIDWEHAARDLQMDYTPVDFAGITYWVR